MPILCWRQHECWATWPETETYETLPSHIEVRRYSMISACFIIIGSAAVSVAYPEGAAGVAAAQSHEETKLFLCWYSQRRTSKPVLCARCVRCDVPPALVAFFTFCVMRRDLAKRHIFGDCASWRWAMTPNFKLSGDFCTMHLPPSFIILCLFVRKLLCWQTHPQTNKPTNPQTNRCRQKHSTLFAMLRRWVKREGSLLRLDAVYDSTVGHKIPL